VARILDRKFVQVFAVSVEVGKMALDNTVEFERFNFEITIPFRCLINKNGRII